MDEFYFPTEDDRNESLYESYDDSDDLSRDLDALNESYDLDDAISSHFDSDNSYDDYSYNESGDLDDLLSDYMQEGSGEIPERPSSRPYDEKSIPSARSSEIDQSVYNKQIENLKRSFKESVDIIESMKSIY